MVEDTVVNVGVVGRIVVVVRVVEGNDVVVIGTLLSEEKDIVQCIIINGANATQSVYVFYLTQRSRIFECARKKERR